jgi:tRNA G26 N,N-dimethylase Trm1
VKQYEGNVNFEQEAMRSTLRETKKDFVLFNPNLYNKEPEIEPFVNLQKRIIDLCRARSSNGLRGLRIMFKSMDRNRDNSLDPTEFKYAMRDYGIPISDLEVTAIVKYFDKNKDG